MCKSWSALPDTGAMLDQDWTLITRMQVLLNVYEAVSAMRSSRGADIHKLPSHVNRVLASLAEMGVNMGVGG